jgi:hypothetical protein
VSGLGLPTLRDYTLWIETISMLGLGLLTLRDFLPGLLVRTFFFNGLCDRTGRPSIGQRIYSSRESSLPTR